MSNTTLMNPTDELFTDLTSAQAEVVAGGYETNDDLNVYRYRNFGTWLGSFNSGSRRLSDAANNRISSVIIKDGLWKFFDRPFYLDVRFVRDTINLGEGRFNNLGVFNFDNKISSIQRIG